MALMDSASPPQPQSSSRSSSSSSGAGSMCPTSPAATAKAASSRSKRSVSSPSSSSSSSRTSASSIPSGLRYPSWADQDAAIKSAAQSSSSSMSSLGEKLASMPMPSAAGGRATSTGSSNSARQRRTATGDNQNSRSRRRPRRSVSFHSRTKVYLVPTLDDWTEDEIVKSYRTDEDEAITQEEIVSTIRIMRRNSGRTSDDDETLRNVTARGLEHLGTSEAMAHRKLRKSRQLNSVLDEQDRQWDNPHLEDHQRIADIANQTSAECRARALASAAEDATYVRRLVRRESAESTGGSEDSGVPTGTSTAAASTSTSNQDTSRRSLRSTVSAGSGRSRSGSVDSAGGQERGNRIRASRSRSNSAASSASLRSDGSRRSSSSRTGR